MSTIDGGIKIKRRLIVTLALAMLGDNEITVLTPRQQDLWRCSCGEHDERRQPGKRREG